MTLWKAQPLKWRGLPERPFPFSPVHKALKFSAAIEGWLKALRCFFFRALNTRVATYSWALHQRRVPWWLFPQAYRQWLCQRILVDWPWSLLTISKSCCWENDQEASRCAVCDDDNKNNKKNKRFVPPPRLNGTIGICWSFLFSNFEPHKALRPVGMYVVVVILCTILCWRLVVGWQFPVF